jgi:hypothetical protein
MAYEWAVPGAKCVCVDDSPKSSPCPDGVELSGDLDGLKYGRVYTVRDVFADPDFGHSVRLVEIVRPLLRHECWEPGYIIARFRPLVIRTLDQDLEVFRHHLTGAPAHSEDA